jgi:hypothetical protein
MQHNDFETLVESKAFKEAVDKSLQPAQSSHASLASEIRSTLAGAYKDLNDSEIEQKFSAQVRKFEPWEKYSSGDKLKEYAAEHGGAVKVRGPDNGLYWFPPGTTHDLAVAYFREKWIKWDNIRPIPGSTTPIDVSNVKSVTWSSKDASISYIETQDGRTLYNSEVSSRWFYLLYASYPVIGFLVPWGAIRTVGWGHSWLSKGFLVA